MLHLSTTTEWALGRFSWPLTEMQHSDRPSISAFLRTAPFRERYYKRDHGTNNLRTVRLHVYESRGKTKW